jgi:hypothetical protein
MTGTVVSTATATTVSAPGSGTAGRAIEAVSAALSGAASGAGGTITFTVFGPQPAPPTDCSSGGTQVGSPVAVSGNLSYNPSAAFTPPGAGTYWWYASYSGDAANLASDSGCGAGMTSTVVAKNFTATTVSAPATGTTGTAIPPGAVGAALGGAASGAGGTITFTVFGPQPAPPSDCSSGGTPVGSPVAVSGLGTYHPTDGFTPGGAGTYWWYASYTGDTANAPSASGCGAGMTATEVSVPQSTTTTTAGNATATYSASSQQVALSASVTSASTVTEGTVTFTVANSSNQTVGQATTGPVSGGSASASYGLPAGLPAGTYTIDAKYTDPGGSYADSPDTATLTVTKATPQLTWKNPAGLTWGTPLSGTQLDATAPVPGTFTYTPKAGTILAPGNNQALSASFTPADTANYTGATKTTALNVGFNPAACITKTVTGPLVISTGQAYCVSTGATITNGVTVKPGGALYLTGGTIKGGLSATGAKALTVCGATVKAGVTITGTTGPLSLGTCGTNTITGNVSLTGNTGGLTYQNNTVTGSLTITGNTGGFHYLTGNKTTGKVTINNNT